MLDELKRRVCAANLELGEKGVAIYTWGISPENAVYNAVVMEKVAEMD